MSRFYAGDKIKASPCPKYNSPKITGHICNVYLSNQTDIKSELVFNVVDSSGRYYAYTEDCLSLRKVQILHAYKDATDEVHWSTRKYDSKERANFGFQEAFEFNKSIELE